MEKDSLRRFMLTNTRVRGEWVHLDTTWQTLLANGDYPEPVKNVLGEALAAVLLLSATIKYEGSLILQIKATGPMHLLVVQANSDGTVRGLARYKDDALATLDEAAEPSLSVLLGEQATMVITVQPNQGKPYQGIVAMNGDTMQDCLQAYFEQSEQLATRLYLATDDTACAGLLLQQLPEQCADDDDGWNRATIMANTLSKTDLLTWDNENLLHRLYHEEQVTVFPAKPIRFQCSCSIERIEAAIQGLGEQEAQDILSEQGQIHVDCEFCNKGYRFDHVDIKRIFTPAAINPSQNSTH